MSSIMNKVKEALHPDKDKSQSGGTHGTHGSGTTTTGSAAEPRFDSGRDQRAEYGGTHEGSSYPKSDNYSYGTGQTGTSGPHSSNLVNKMDPRVDSDRDHSSRAAGSNKSGGAFFGSGNTGVTGTTGTGAYGSSGGAPDYSSRTTGTSDMYGSSGVPESTRTHGTTGATGTYGTSGIPEGTTQGIHGQHGHHGHHGHGHHEGRDTGLQSGTAGGGYEGSYTGPTGGTYGGSTTGTTGGTYGGSTTGATGGGRTGGVGGTYAGSGPAPHTAGPHKSDLLNKADPRVDSNLDGSKTYGGNKTFDRSTESVKETSRDPTDAAQVPPSVLRKHVGQPTPLESEGKKHH